MAPLLFILFPFNTQAVFTVFTFSVKQGQYLEPLTRLSGTEGIITYSMSLKMEIFFPLKQCNILLIIYLNLFSED